MDGPSAFDADRFDLDGADPARLGQPGLGHRPEPLVLRPRRQRVRRRLDHEIRLAVERRVLPFIACPQVDRRRHVLRITGRRALVDPADDRRDLLAAQAAIVLELLDADGLIDVPWRHLARLDAGLDRTRPRPALLERPQRHRRDRAGPMAALALLLEDRRNVFRKRRPLRHLCERSARHEQGAYRRGGHPAESSEYRRFAH